ncbi:MAG: hypothetical protein FWD28_05380 [Treponema sp.]|nr:hypothetical protein [Treponema sp.]
MKLPRKRLFISKRAGDRERVKLISKAVENNYDTIVFSLDDNFFKKNNKNFRYAKLARHNGLNIEAGGSDLPLLIPRWMFLFDKELFRMVQGRRTPFYHFCPTNPKTTEIIAKRVRKLIERSLSSVSVPRTLHLLPDTRLKQENTWCQCPACRAFRPYEQYLIAVNAAADILAQYDHEAKIAYIDFDTEPEAARIKPRKNAIICAPSSAK